MNEFVLDINADTSVVFSKRLEELSRSAFPVAVRQTLNAAAFDVKQNTLEISATKNFIRRSPSFFKRFSGVNKAIGFNVNSMKAEVGMTDMGQQTAQTAIAHMNEQESGGNITGGKDYLKAARSGSLKRRVGKANYYNKSNVVKGAFKRIGTAKSNFVAAAFVALQTGKLMKFKSLGGKTFYSQVLSISGSLKNRGINIKTKLVIEDRGNIAIKATHFSREAGMMSAAKMPEFYRKEAEKQFYRALKG